ncbi:unnamed protein product [Mycena citricolor]|uniref:Secreted protein n=1 Tax=Mycena citricolor TaxID=2018698 RepID=A0AAD2HJT6_9AGAR|nr:unnamed protein product [Mycena citricolor]
MFALRHFTSLLLLVSTASWLPAPLPSLRPVRSLWSRSVTPASMSSESSSPPGFGCRRAAPNQHSLRPGTRHGLTVGPLIVELEAAIEIAVVALGTVSLSGVGSKSQCAGLLAEIIRISPTLSRMQERGHRAYSRDPHR